MKTFTSEHPNLKYAFFWWQRRGRKNRHGWRYCVWYANQGKKTLLTSTNPVHSLSSLLDQNVYGKPTLVNGTTNLFAYEIDTAQTIERSKNEIREKINWFLKFADIPTKADEFVESATMNPAFEESAMFENMIDLMFQDEYDIYVFELPQQLMLVDYWACQKFTLSGSTR